MDKERHTCKERDRDRDRDRETGQLARRRNVRGLALLLQHRDSAL